MADGVTEILGEKVKIAKRNKLHTFKVMPQRWIVERSFLAGLKNAEDFGKTVGVSLNTSLQLVNFSFLTLILYGKSVDKILDLLLEQTFHQIVVDFTSVTEV